MKNPQFGPAGRRYFKAVRDGWQLHEAQYEVLVQACHALDRCEGARATIAEQGAYVFDGKGVLRAHPAVNIERDARSLFLRLQRELALSEDASDTRPPALKGRYQHRA